MLDTIKKAALSRETVDAFVHAATVVINTLTERKGHKTAYITTKGFRKVLDIQLIDTQS